MSNPLIKSLKHTPPPAVIGGGMAADKAVLLRQVSETSHRKCEYCDRPNTGRSETCNGCGAPIS